MTEPAMLGATPLRYQPSYEQPEPDEAETAKELVEAMHKISETVAHDEGHAHRSVHAKSHGLLRGEIEIPAGLPEALAQGVFSRPGTYAVAMRFSTVPGDLLDDSVSTPRGLALKIVGVDGPRLPGSEGDTTQDFLMVNGPAFSASNAKKFLMNVKLLAATTDKVQGLKKVLSATLRGIESLVEKAGGESVTLKALGGHPETHILGETFFTQVPVLYGDYMAKLSIAPASPELLALKDAQVDMKDRPNALREVVVDFFRAGGGTWELRAQLCTDIETMPIEDASIVWPEDQSPYVTVGRITVGPQTAWSDARSAAVDDGMSFSPWHGLAAHRPIGSVMRVRKQAYEMAARFRSQFNKVSVAEPVRLDSLPD